MDNKNNSAHTNHGMPKGDARALKISGWLTGVYFIIELGIGYWSGSISVISDSFHTFSAVGGVLIALVAGYFSTRPASQYATFGLIRSEIVGALFNGLFLLIMALYIMWMGYERLLSPIEVLPGPMLLAAGGGLITEIISLRLMFGRQKDNLNMKGAMWHIIQTFVGSIIIIIAAVVIYFTNFYLIDPILGMAFGLVLFWASWGIIRDALKILLDVVPKDLDMDALVKAVSSIGTVKNVHHAHAWTLTSGKNIVSMHIQVEEIKGNNNLLDKIYQLLKNEFSIYFSTIQIEIKCPEDSESNNIDYNENTEHSKN